MKKFLQLVADDLLQRSNEDLSNYIVIFPGKRSGVFFKHLLSNSINKPILSPEIYAINEFVQLHSGLMSIESIPAIIKLYELYKQKVSNAETIEQFWFFGEMLLADFDDIDKYRVDASKLFSYIVDIKEIDSIFGFEDEHKTALIKRFWEALYRGVKEHDKEKIRGRFLHFWKILHPLYNDFRAQLMKNGMGYEGMLYRIVAEKAVSDSIDLDGKTPVFIGFNALSESESQLFKYLKKQGALFYWDYDNWYVDDKLQEAGYFIRKNLAQFPNAIAKSSMFNNLGALRQVKTIGAPGELEMAQELAHVVKNQFGKTEDPLQNGIVLGDETLLIPALQLLPEAGSLNVTMGLPLRSTSVFGLINTLLEMPANQTKAKGKMLYRAEWAVEILQQPFWGDANHEKFLEKIKNENRFYVTQAELATLSNVSVCFPETEVDIISYLKGILEYFINIENNQEVFSVVNTEAAVKIIQSLNQIEKQVNQVNVTLSSQMLISLIRKVISTVSLTLEGEPLKGNQLMGLIEARTLDFENLIIVSANEGFLPSLNVAPSFIPYNLRKAFGLLTYENQDAIFAYYFYRAVQRTKKLTFIYNSNENDNNYGEKSRFLQQMAFELNAEFIDVETSHIVKPFIKSEITIEKSQEIIQKLNLYLSGQKLLYPLHLNTYITCRLKYYFTYIAGLKEPEKIEPGVDQRIFGLIFHDSMEKLYKPFVESGKTITKSDLEKVNNTALIQKTIQETMQEYFSDIQYVRGDDGMVELIEQVVLKYIQRVINNDKQIEYFSIPGLEKQYETSYKFDENRTVKLAGKIDRLQQVGNKLWVIDYKTGKSPEKRNVIFEDLFRFDADKRSDGAFQAYLYAVIMESQQAFSDMEVIPSLMYIQDDKPPVEVAFHDQKDPRYADLREPFCQGLNDVLIDLFSYENPFSQTENHDKCKYCQFRVICQRH